jgi:hypothetical protein
MTDQRTAHADLADQVALVNAIEVATLITAKGKHFAIKASTVEIVAMAQHLMRLSTLADLTYDMLATADLLPAVRDAEGRNALKRAVSDKISVVGASLEALGYGQQLQSSPEEKSDGQG